MKLGHILGALRRPGAGQPGGAGRCRLRPQTANVVIGNAFDIPGITVDTHFLRLSQRWRWTANDRSGEGRGRRLGADPAPGVDDAVTGSSARPRSATRAGRPAGSARSPGSARRRASASGTRRWRPSWSRALPRWIPGSPGERALRLFRPRATARTASPDWLRPMVGRTIELRGTRASRPAEPAARRQRQALGGPDPVRLARRGGRS